MKWPIHSIRGTVLLGIVAGVLLPALLLLALDQWQSRDALRQQAARDRSALLTLAATRLTLPAWSLDVAALHAIQGELLGLPSVCVIEVAELQPPGTEGHGVPPLVREQRCESSLVTGWLDTRLLYEGQHVGRLRVGFDDSEIARQLTQRRTSMAALVAIQVLAGMAILAAVLSARLLRPIDRLKAQAGLLAAREPTPPQDWHRDDELGQLGQHLNTVHAQIRGLIEELEGKNEQLHRMAMFDHLTGLPNRTLMRELFSREAARARRVDGQLGLMFIDLDHFKQVNDRWGHAAGDELLVHTAARIRAALRESDLVCRVSGDEFMALFDTQRDSGAAELAALRVVSALEQPLHLPAADEPVRVGASIGYALFPRDGDDFESLCRAADVAMYRSKEHGRGRSTAYHADMDALLRQRIDLERELRLAIEEQQLRLHYQPVVDARSGLVVGGEALVRWQHPERGLLMPDAFIGVAESSGLVRPLGAWVLRAAAAQLARWHAMGLGALQISINVSALQLREPEFVEAVRTEIDRYGLRPGSLTLELTESTLLDDSEGAMRAVASLRQGGVMLAVDDFGTGYSSLAALKLVRPDRLKIDRGFVHDLPGAADDAALIEAMFGMARALDIEVVAEGVETAAQRDWLAMRGGHLQQGWLWSKAVPPDDFVAAVERHRRAAMA
ncbi:MAG: EAL domain-containing protein [Burkholderiales bacterium]|nr:EAL domain-containing protein [Burkholderiales bacterium]